MKHFKLLYLVIAGAFLLGLFACGGAAKEEQATDAEQLIEEILLAIENGEVVFEEGLGEDFEEEMNSSSAVECEPNDIPAVMSSAGTGLGDPTGEHMRTAADYCYVRPQDDPDTGNPVGDIDQDGDFDIGDTGYISNLLTGRASASLEIMRLGNINEDDVLDAMDLIIGLGYLFRGWSAELTLPTSIISGDANGDGEAVCFEPGKVSDVMTLINYVTRGVEYTLEQFIASDLNLDNVLDIRDAEIFIDFCFYGNPVERLPFTDLGVLDLTGDTDDDVYDDYIDCEDASIPAALKALHDC